MLKSECKFEIWETNKFNDEILSEFIGEFVDEEYAKEFIEYKATIGESFAMVKKKSGDIRKLTELEENEVMGRKEGQDECDFLHISSLTMDSLIENYKIYKEDYDKAELKYRELKTDNKLNGNTVYNYHFYKEIYESLKGDIVRRTVEEHDQTRKAGITEVKEISEDYPVMKRKGR